MSASISLLSHKVQRCLSCCLVHFTGRIAVKVLIQNMYYCIMFHVTWSCLEQVEYLGVVDDEQPLRVTQTLNRIGDDWVADGHQKP